MNGKSSLADLFERGVFTQFLLVTTLSVTIAFLVINQREVPEILGLSFSAVLGYYFRAQTSTDNRAIVDRTAKAINGS